MTRVAIAHRLLQGSSGTVNSLLRQAGFCASQGWETHLYGEAMDKDAVERAGCVPHRIIGWPWGSRLKRRLFARSFERRIGNERYDLVVGHGDTLLQDVLVMHNCVHAAHEAARGSPLPESSGPGWMHARMLRGRLFKRLIANSNLMKQDFVKRFGIPPEDITVVYPGYDPGRFRPEDRGRLRQAARRELGAGDGDFLAGLITSGDFEKRGAGLFIKILGRLPADVRANIRGLIVGKERRLERWRRMAQDAGLGPRVRFLAPQENVERLLHALDVFVYPALFEEFGQSVQEAMACAVPVLTSERVGAAELLAGRRRDMVLDAPGEELFAAKLTELSRNPDARRAWGDAAAAACLGNTWGKNCRAHFAVYESSLRRESAPSSID